MSPRTARPFSPTTGKAATDADGLWNPGGPQDTRVVRSADGGESWTDDRFLSYEPLRGASPFGKIRRSDDGTLFMPIYGGDRSNTLKAAFTVGPASGLSCLLQSGGSGQNLAGSDLRGPRVSARRTFSFCRRTTGFLRPAPIKRTNRPFIPAGPPIKGTPGAT